MITPNFELSQSVDKLFVVITAPLANIAEAEVYVDRDELRFYASPYFLRLHLPGPVNDCEDPQVQYDVNDNTFSIELNKSNPGEEFEDLDLIAKFLTPRRNNRATVRPDIQVLNNQPNEEENAAVPNGDDDEGENADNADEWLLEQQIPEQVPPKPIKKSVRDSNDSRYGFANKLIHIPNILKEEFKDVFEIEHIIAGRVTNRSLYRECIEIKKFDDDHYLFDLMVQSDELREVFRFQPTFNSGNFVGDELSKLKVIGNREYILDKEERKAALLSLVDILCAFAYDHRTTLGEPTVESAWTINKLCGTLCYLENFDSVKEVITCFIRRSVCYPLYRNWDLTIQVLEDVEEILNSGVKCVIRCFLAIHKMFNESEPRYVLNQLYIVDYIIWLQKQRDMNMKLNQLAQSVTEIRKRLTKDDAGFELELLESAATFTVEDELSENLVKLNINHNANNCNESHSDDDEDRANEKAEELDSDDDPNPND